MHVDFTEPAHGSLEMLRDIATEQLRMVAFHASLAADQGMVSADAGMTHNSKRAIAHLRMVGDVLKMMHEHRQRDIARLAERDGAAVTLGLEQRGTA